MKRSWSAPEIAALVDAANDANLTPRQAIASLYAYRTNLPTRKIMRRKTNGSMQQMVIHGKDEAYHEI